MEMLNGNLCCEVVSNDIKAGGVYIPPTEQKYKVLLVSEGTEIPKGKNIYVPINAGTDVEINGSPYVIVNYREVILILD